MTRSKLAVALLFSLLAAAVFPLALASATQAGVECAKHLYALDGTQRIKNFPITVSCPETNWTETKPTTWYGNITFDIPCCPAGKNSQTCQASATYKGNTKTISVTVDSSCSGGKHHGLIWGQ